MRLLDPYSSFILCAFCGDAAENMASHLESTHAKELLIISSNYQAPGNPVSRWIWEVRNLQPPPKIFALARVIQNPRRNSAAMLSMVAAPTPDEAICLDCCKPVDNRRRHLFVYHVKRPIFQCPCCDFSSHFDAAKVHAHIAESHENNAQLRVIDQRELFQEEIAGWEERCYVTGPPSEEVTTKHLVKVSASNILGNGEKEIATSSSSLQMNARHVQTAAEQSEGTIRPVRRNKDPIHQQESAQVTKSVALFSPTTPIKAPAFTPSLDVNSKEGKSNNSAPPARFPAKCQICTALSVDNLDELKVHNFLCRKERPFSCNFCVRQFKRQCDATLHRRQAHAEKPSHSVPSDAGRSSSTHSNRAVETEVQSVATRTSRPVKPVSAAGKKRMKASSPCNAPNGNRVAMNSLSDGRKSDQSVDNMTTLSQKVHHRPVPNVKSVTPSPPLAVRRVRRRCSGGAEYALSPTLGDSPVDQVPLFPTKSQRKEQQCIGAVTPETSYEMTPSLKRRAAGVSAVNPRVRPRKQPKLEVTASGQQPSRVASTPVFESVTVKRAEKAETALPPIFHVDTPSSTSTYSSAKLSSNSFSFDSLRELRRSSDGFECVSCMERFPTQPLAAEHEKKRSCFAHLKNLRALQRPAKDQLMTFCVLCEKRISWRNAAMHIYTHCKPFKCSNCSREHHSPIPAEHFTLKCRVQDARCIDLRPELEGELTAVAIGCLGGSNKSCSPPASRRSRKSRVG